MFSCQGVRQERQMKREGDNKSPSTVTQHLNSISIYRHYPIVLPRPTKMSENIDKSKVEMIW